MSEIKFPSSQDKDDPRRKLAGQWVLDQRKAYHQRQLSPDHIRKLEQLTGWNWDAFLTKWNTSYEKLIEFVKTNGRLPIANRPKERVLGVWITTQRTARKKGKLSKYRIKQLERIPEYNSDKWDVKYAEFKKLPNLPSRTSKDQKKAASAIWARTQRVAYDKGTLSKDKIRKLESITGWSWKVFDDKWDEICSNLIEFIEKHKRFPSQTREDQEEKTLGNWSQIQRTRKNQGKLSKDRIKRIEQIPGWSWRVLDNQWDIAYAQLMEFIKKNRSFPSTISKNSKEKFLGTWMSNQRSAKKRKQKRLSKTRTKQLEQIPEWHWKPISDQWNAIYVKLIEFVQKNKRSPSEHSKNITEKTLGRWIGTQRAAKKKGQKRLSQKRIKQLELTPGWRW